MLKKLSVIGCATVATLLLGACSDGAADNGATQQETQPETSQLDNSFLDGGQEVPAPEGFDPLGTGKVYSGAFSVTATAGSDLKTDYALIDGTAYFDLGDLEPLDNETTVTVHVRNGGVSVILPKDVPVELQCDIKDGEGDCSADRYNPDASGEVLRMKLDVTGGKVDVAELEAAP
ncbi:hypothetical protein [Corynebacterium sp.]|uniref:hypothetical protein n=1 Tax=Corynebacterium sp. TaxID=1720 RepID=UPI0026DB754B|nr:hypothetical protein [Corynebacterium sp.]MDO5077100.1 hypothetical protein [Corynebacterium sp.]